MPTWESHEYTYAEIPFAMSCKSSLLTESKHHAYRHISKWVWKSTSISWLMTNTELKYLSWLCWKSPRLFHLQWSLFCTNMEIWELLESKANMDSLVTCMFVPQDHIKLWTFKWTVENSNGNVYDVCFKKRRKPNTSKQQKRNKAKNKHGYNLLQPNILASSADNRVHVNIAIMWQSGAETPNSMTLVGARQLNVNSSLCLSAMKFWRLKGAEASTHFSSMVFICNSS